MNRDYFNLREAFAEVKSGKKEKKKFKDSQECWEDVSNEKLEPYIIAERLASQKSRFAVLNDRLHYYDKEYGCYHVMPEGAAGEKFIRNILPKQWRNSVNSNKIRETVKCLEAYRDLHTSVKSDEELQGRYLNFCNGILDLKNDKKRKHKKKYGFTSFVNAPYPFDGKAKGKCFEQFVKDVAGEDKQVENLLQEVLGLMISDVRNLKVAVFFYGVPHSGKSLLIEVMREIVGEAFCSSISMHDLNDKHRVACLYQKKMNTCAEISDEHIKSLNRFKELTGGDTCIGEAKFKDPFSFRNQALLVFGGNQLPQLKTLDTTNAFFDRMLIVPFLHGKSRKDQDPKLKERLLKEKSYIVQYAVAGLKRLIKNKCVFSSCDVAERIKAEYICEQNTFAAFVEERCRLGHEEYAYSYRIEEEYRAYCEEKNLKAVDSRMMHRILQDTYKLERKKRKKKGENRNGYSGIALMK